MAQIVLQNPRILLVLPLVWLLVVGFAWRRRFKPFGPFLLRLVILVLIAVALSRPTLEPSAALAIEKPQERLVVLVDQSASLGEVGQQALRNEAARLIQGVEDAHVLVFANQPLWVDDLTSLTAPDANPGEGLDPTISNLAEALSLGGELLSLNDEPGRIVLLSDGIPTTGDTMDVVDQLAQQNIPVDVLIPDNNTLQAWKNSQNDVSVVSLTVPPVLRQEENFDVEVVVNSEAPAPEATLTLTHPAGGTVLAEDVVSLEPGLNRFTFSATENEIGSHAYQVSIATPDDHVEENNNLSAFTQVYAAPRILIVSEEAEAASLFAASLRNTGFEVETMRPANLPDHLSELEPYDGMVLLNVSARSLQVEQMISVQEFVRSLGRGLLVTGGRNSFALGRYQDTPLAEVLPVTLDPPPREERPPVALLLVIDHSGSMVEDHNDPVTRLTMAKEAAIRATDILGPADLIGIMMFDNQYDWVIPFQKVSNGADLLEIQQRIARIPPGGGTRILQALEVSIPELIAQDTAASRHAVLFSDGKSFDGQKTIADYNLIVDAALEANITLSTIAIGGDTDEDLLAYLAERGRGRYHHAKTPEELPELTISESDILRSDTVQEGDFVAAIYAPHPLVRGLFAPLPSPDRNEAPTLSGYLAMTPKPEAEIALQVGPGDPLLSVWGYGLGRVVAWSSDTGHEWTTAWRAWPEFDRFWGQVVGYTVPAPDLGLLQLDTTVKPDGTVVLAADGVNSIGQPVEFARTEATLISPNGTENQIRLRQVGPGHYERQLRLPDKGAYQLTVNQSRGDEPDEATTMGFVLAYPDEYRLPPDGTGQPLLEQIAVDTGGQTFSLGQSLRTEASADEESNELTEPVELWFWFLLVALLLWPLEIAWRRWAYLRIQ